MGCNKISDTCGKRSNATCVDYEGSLSSHTQLEDCGCFNMEDVVEDINTQLDELYDQTDLSGLENNCIEYNKAGTSLTIPEALLGLESKVCELVEKTGLNDPEPCDTCTDPCDDEGVCTNGIVFYNFANDDFPISEVGVWKSGVTASDIYATNLVYPVTEDGRYKFTVEVNATFDTGDVGKVGVNVNATDPVETSDLAGYFSSAEVSGDTNPKTLSFIKDLVKTDSVRIQFKLVSGTLFHITSAKLIIEKVA